MVGKSKEGKTRQFKWKSWEECKKAEHEPAGFLDRMFSFDPWYEAFASHWRYRALKGNEDLNNDPNYMAGHHDESRIFYMEQALAE